MIVVQVVFDQSNCIRHHVRGKCVLAARQGKQRVGTQPSAIGIENTAMDAGGHDWLIKLCFQLQPPLCAHHTHPPGAAAHTQHCARLFFLLLPGCACWGYQGTYRMLRTVISWLQAQPVGGSSSNKTAIDTVIWR